MSKKVDDFVALSLSIASEKDILSWSKGEIVSSETINYRTLKPEPDGLFCEKIFGPVRDWECGCGRYKRVRFKGIICEYCGVEVLPKTTRRERMGHIQLAYPVVHIWYFKGIPSFLGYILDISPKTIEQIVYFHSAIVTRIDKEAIKRDEEQLHALINNKVLELEKEIGNLNKLAEEDSDKKVNYKEACKHYQEEIDRLKTIWEHFRGFDLYSLEQDIELFEEIKLYFGDYFSGGSGSMAIEDCLNNFDLNGTVAALSKELQTLKNSKNVYKYSRALKKIKLLQDFQKNKDSNYVKNILIKVLPVLPADLRPIVQLNGGRFASSDLNDLYRRVINRNNRLKKFIALNAPEIIINNERRMLQESVDALLSNAQKSKPVLSNININARPLKSLSDIIRGKQGRFRQNLLGKRVDYSGRSVIMVGPELKLYQCGLPKSIALELFTPFIIAQLLKMNYVNSVKGAKDFIVSHIDDPQLWTIVTDVMKDKCVMLNRAPTLHRLSIQAFEPILVEGQAIQIHPLVCTAFNADFDGDQMAVHLPLSLEAQAENKMLMLSSHNLISPANARPIVAPTQDIVIGIYYLTAVDNLEEEKDDYKTFSSYSEVIYAYDKKIVDIKDVIYVSIDRDSVITKDEGLISTEIVDGKIKTSVGRIIFNSILPDNFPFVNYTLDKSKIASLLRRISANVKQNSVFVNFLDNIKNLGFYWSTHSGLTLSIADINKNIDKEAILKKYSIKADNSQEDYELGMISKDEYDNYQIDIWTQAIDEISQMVEKKFVDFDMLHLMVKSGARGNMINMRQMIGIRGLVANARNQTIPKPIKASFKDGLSILEYFVSIHGARKGLADTALRTADSGYLTRCLVDCCQDVFIVEDDCHTTEGVLFDISIEKDGVRELVENVDLIVGRRVLAEDVIYKDSIIGKAGLIVDSIFIEKCYVLGINSLKVRSALMCTIINGICAMCYGVSMVDNTLAHKGTAIGILAAQSIGEPGTQLTMQTFHSGGVAGRDITHGLPQIVDLFEMRYESPDNVILARADGKVRIGSLEDQILRVDILSDDGKVLDSYSVDKKAELLVKDNDTIRRGDQITAGIANIKEFSQLADKLTVELYLVRLLQMIYSMQGVLIHDKHFEVVIRQIFLRSLVVDNGDTSLSIGEAVIDQHLKNINQQMIEEGKKPAIAQQLALGITRVALITNSWLSAASFQETTRVLTQSSLECRTDHLLGLKENVIIGRLIPVGTGSISSDKINIKVKTNE